MEFCLSRKVGTLLTFYMLHLLSVLLPVSDKLEYMKNVILLMQCNKKDCEKSQFKIISAPLKCRWDLLHTTQQYLLFKIILEFYSQKLKLCLKKGFQNCSKPPNSCRRVLIATHICNNSQSLSTFSTN